MPVAWGHAGNSDAASQAHPSHQSVPAYHPNSGSGVVEMKKSATRLSVLESRKKHTLRRHPFSSRTLGRIYSQVTILHYSVLAKIKLDSRIMTTRGRKSSQN